MATQRKKGQIAGKKVKSLATRSVNARRAKAVKGGASLLLPRMKWEVPVKY